MGTIRDQKDEPDNDGYTPAFYAAASQNSEIYDMLVKAGADVHRVDKVSRGSRSRIKVGSRIDLRQ